MMKKHISRTRSEAENQVPSLKVYDGRRVDNFGKTFQILNNPLTLPHTTDHVFVEYNGQRYEAQIGTYTSKNRCDICICNESQLGLTSNISYSR